MEFVQQNSGAVLAGAAATIVVIGLGLYWYSLRTTKQQQGWADLYGSQLIPAAEARMAKLNEVVQRYQDPALVSAALLSLGDAALQEATSSTRTPEDRQRFRKQAVEAFQTVIQAAPDQKLPVASAHFKLAAIYEEQKQWDEAARHYQSIVDEAQFAKLPQHDMAVEALARLDKLKEPIVYAPSKKPTTAPATQASKVPSTMKAAKGAAAKAIDAAVPKPKKPAATKKSKAPATVPVKASKP